MRPNEVKYSLLRAAACMMVVGFFVPTSTWAQRRNQGEKRREILEQLGLEKKPVASEDNKKDGQGKTATEDAQNSTSAPQAGRGQAEAPPATRKAAPRGGGPYYVPTVHPVLMEHCQSCHRPGGRRPTRFPLGGETEKDFAVVSAAASGASPEKSKLLMAARGDKHMGGKIFAPDAAGYQTLLRWMVAGAPFAAPAAADEAAGSKPAAQDTATTTRDTSPELKDEDTVRDVALESSEVAEPSSPQESAVSRSDFVGSGVHSMLVQNCGSCHGSQMQYVADDNPDAHFASVRPFVDPTDVPASVLLSKAMGEAHGGGAVLEADDHELQQLVAWIEAGAMGPGVAAGPQKDELDGISEPVEESAPHAPPGVAAGSKPYHRGGRGKESGFRLPGMLDSFRLHGRFDLNYERRNYTDNPFASGGDNALRSYHHFLFLTREEPDDPFGIDVELTSLQFWEASYTHRDESGRWQAGVRMGKLLVPFGADPLYHHSYGGLAGFDQRIMPIIWSQEGIAGNFRMQWNDLAVVEDFYVVRGYALRQADAVLNLQGDFSSTDNIQFGLGNRLGLAYGPLTAWYSAYYNPLDFGRRLFMQALDVSLWRLRGIPVLQDITISAGALRADVSGGTEGVGGAGDDYYHFGSYFQVRYYPIRGLYVQYRQGVRTFDNRGGLFADPRRYTHMDASTHSIGVVGHYRGVMMGLWHFWNLEKVNEEDDDFLRFTVAYAF